MFLRFNPANRPNAQWELVSENDQSVQSEGYLELSMVPNNAGDRINGLVFVATKVHQPDATPTIVAPVTVG
jgi:hypothetical protein